MPCSRQRLRRITLLSRTFTSASITALQTGQIALVISRKPSSRSTFARASTAAICPAPFLDAGEHVLDDRAAVVSFHSSDLVKRLHEPRQRGEHGAAAAAAAQVARNPQPA